MSRDATSDVLRSCERIVTILSIHQGPPGLARRCSHARRDERHGANNEQSQGAIDDAEHDTTNSPRVFTLESPMIRESCRRMASKRGQSHHQASAASAACPWRRASCSAPSQAGLRVSLRASSSGLISTPPLTENIQNWPLTNRAFASGGVCLGVSKLAIGHADSSRKCAGRQRSWLDSAALSGAMPFGG